MKRINIFTVIALSLAIAGFAGSAAADNCGSGSAKSGDQATMKAKASYKDAEKKDTEKAVTADIVTTAISAGSFKTLVTAVKAAGLVETLQGEGPFTVFAPTDDAFAALPEGTVESLLKDKEALTAVLTYHVLPGTVKAADVVKASDLESLNGQKIKVKVGEESVLVDEAAILKTDLICTNGVIHVIDKVMLPEISE
jgi:uncharacterized surface protein with fasciclin (FAS1) repeats